MPRKNPAAKGSEMEKMLSTTRTLQNRIAYIKKIQQMAEKPKLDAAAANALHNMLETVAEKRMFDDMRMVMNVIYEYALDADEAETSTQSARHVTEGRFCESVSRAFAVVSSIVLEGEDIAAKRPLSALLKLVTYVAEDATTANAELGSMMLSPVFSQWVKPRSDDGRSRDADIQFLALELLAVLFTEANNVSLFFTPTWEAHEKICSILSFLIEEGSRSAEISALSVKVLADLARTLQQTSTQSNPVIDNMSSWLEDSKAPSATSTCDEIMADFRTLSIDISSDDSDKEGKKKRDAFCAKLLALTGKTPFKSFRCKTVGFAHSGENAFSLEDGISVTEHCISSLVAVAQAEEDEENECASEVLHIENKSIRSVRACGHTSLSLQLLTPIMSFHAEDDGEPSVVLHFQNAGDKADFLALSLGTEQHEQKEEDEPFKSQDSRVRCDIAIMDNEGRIVTPMPRNQRDAEESQPHDKIVAPKGSEIAVYRTADVGVQDAGHIVKDSQEGSSTDHVQRSSLAAKKRGVDKSKRADDNDRERDVTSKTFGDESTTEQGRAAEEEGTPKNQTTSDKKRIAGKKRSAAKEDEESALSKVATEDEDKATVSDKKNSRKREADVPKQDANDNKLLADNEDESVNSKKQSIEKPRDVVESEGRKDRGKSDSSQQKQDEGKDADKVGNVAAAPATKGDDPEVNPPFMSKRSRAGIDKKHRSKKSLSSSDDEVEEEADQGWAPPVAKSQLKRSVLGPKKSELSTGSHFNDLKIEELRSLLRSRSLSTRGSKSDLVKRLEEDEKRVTEATSYLEKPRTVPQPSTISTKKSVPPPDTALPVAKIPQKESTPKRSFGVGKRTSDVKASDMKSRDAASVFDFSSDEDDAATKPKAKAGYRKTTTSVKKPAPSRKEPLDVRASSGPAFKAAETIASRDKYVEEWVNQSAVKPAATNRKCKDPTSESLDSTAATLKAAAHELKNRSGCKRDDTASSQKGADSQKQHKQSAEESKTSQVKGQKSSTKISTNKASVSDDTTRKLQRAQRSLFTPPHPSEPCPKEVDEKQETQLEGAEAACRSRTKTSSVGESRKIKGQAVDDIHSDKASNDEAGLGLGSEASKPSERTLKSETLPPTSPMKQDTKAAKAANAVEQNATENMEESVRPRRKRAATPPAKQENDGTTSLLKAENDVKRRKADITAATASVSPKLAVDSPVKKKPITAKEAADPDQLEPDMKLGSGLDESELSMMGTSVKPAAHEQHTGDSLDDLLDSDAGPHKDVKSLQNMVASQTSVLGDLADNDLSPAPTSKTPKKQLFLSRKGGGRLNQESLEFSPIEKSDSEPESKAHKATWESPGTEGESDALEPAVSIGVKRPIGSNQFCAMIGEKLERFVTDMGKRKRRKLRAACDEQASKMHQEARAVVAEANTSVSKLTDLRKTEMAKFEQRRQELESTRATKFQELKQKFIKLHQTRKELQGMHSSLKERNQKRRADLAEKARERAKKLRVACSTEMKKIEASVSSEKAAQDADMKQLKNLIGQLFSE